MKKTKRERKSPKLGSPKIVSKNKQEPEIGLKASIPKAGVNHLSNLFGAASYERIKVRDDYRNGDRKRKDPLSKAMGTVSARIPKA